MRISARVSIGFYVLIFSYFTLPVKLYGQPENPISANYRSYPDGEHKIYYPSGALYIHFAKVNGRLRGDYLCYYKNGKISEWNKFDAGQFHGPAISFDQKGDTTGFDYYRHDTLLISKQWTYYKNGKVKDYYCANFKDSLVRNAFDRQDTTHKKYFEYDTRKLLTENYNMDEFAGYYETGELKYKVKGIKWQYEGEYTEYFKNGKIKEKGYYKSDQLEGDYTIFNENGTIKAQKYYRAGKAIKKPG